MSKFILLIDDDQDDAKVFQEALSELQLTSHFEHFDDRRKALQQFSNLGSDRPDIIFLNMSTLNGWDCLNKTVRLIISKNRALPPMMSAAAFLTKPDDYEEVKEKLTRLITN